MATAVVGIVHNKDLWIGADSCFSTTYHKDVRFDTKAWAAFRESDGEPFAFAVCGSPRVCQLLKYKLPLPPQDADETDEEYMVVKFTEAVRSVLSLSGSLRKDDNIETVPGNTSFIVGFRSGLYTVHNDLQVGVHGEYVAEGSGMEYSFGALYATTKVYAQKPKDRIVIALAAASQFAPHVSPPYKILHINASTKKVKEIVLS